jgi:hypothetical protein
LKPFEEQMERAVAALLPLVHERKPSLNPEDLHESAVAVLSISRGEPTDAEVEAAARSQIDGARRKAEALHEDFD